MTRRGWLITLVISVALLLAAFEAVPDLRFFGVALGGVLITALRLSVALACVGAVVIGAMCRSWQGAIAFPLIASAPALAYLLLLGFPTTANALYLAAFLVALGLFGWLLRFVRAEFAA